MYLFRRYDFSSYCLCKVDMFVLLLKIINFAFTIYCHNVNENILVVENGCTSSSICPAMTVFDTSRASLRNFFGMRLQSIWT